MAACSGRGFFIPQIYETKWIGNVRAIIHGVLWWTNSHKLEQGFCCVVLDSTCPMRNPSWSEVFGVVLDSTCPTRNPSWSEVFGTCRPAKSVAQRPLGLGFSMENLSWILNKFCWQVRWFVSIFVEATRWGFGLWANMLCLLFNWVHDQASGLRQMSIAECSAWESWNRNNPISEEKVTRQFWSQISHNWPGNLCWRFSREVTHERHWFLIARGSQLNCTTRPDTPENLGPTKLQFLLIQWALSLVSIELFFVAAHDTCL